MARRKDHTWPPASSAFQDYVTSGADFQVSYLCLKKGVVRPTKTLRVNIVLRNRTVITLNNHLYKDRSPEL